MQELIHQKQEPAQRVSQLPEAGELQKAVENVKIRNDSVENLKQVLRLVMIKIGLRAQNWPTDEEKLVLIEHVTAHYGGHTCEEIKLAFDMAITGKLEFKKDESANCFGDFTCIYFSSVMNAYRKWAREEYKEPAQNQLPAPKKESMDDNEFIEMNFKTWQVLKNYGIISIRCYGILVKQYKINLTQADKDAIYAQVEKTLKERMATDKFWNNELQPIFTSPNPELWKTRVLNECKRKAIENYFLTLIAV